MLDCNQDSSYSVQITIKYCFHPIINSFACIESLVVKPESCIPLRKSLSNSWMLHVYPRVAQIWRYDTLIDFNVMLFFID